MASGKLPSRCVIMCIVERTCTSNHRQAGVTLIEVMVGMMVIAIVFLSTMATLDIGFRASQNSRLNADAQFAMEAEVERIRSLSWSELQALQDQFENNKTSGKTTPFVTNSNAQLTTSLEIADRDGRADQLQVLLSVAWEDSKGKSHDARLVTIITQRGISAS